jgi:hypothetical protein
MSHTFASFYALSVQILHSTSSRVIQNFSHVHINIHSINLLQQSDIIASNHDVHIGADTGAWGDRSPTFIPALLVLLFTGDYPLVSKKNFLGSLHSP